MSSSAQFYVKGSAGAAAVVNSMVSCTYAGVPPWHTPRRDAECYCVSKFASARVCARGGHAGWRGCDTTCFRFALTHAASVICSASTPARGVRVRSMARSRGISRCPARARYDVTSLRQRLVRSSAEPRPHGPWSDTRGHRGPASRRGCADSILSAILRDGRAIPSGS